VRSAESFLVKRDRGRVNHVDRDQGLAYWFRMNNNYDTDQSIQRHLPMMRDELAKLMADPEIAQAHTYSVACHHSNIEELERADNYARFCVELTSERLEKLARLHGHFGANIFLSGPAEIINVIVQKSPDEDWFFTLNAKGETMH
jgi:hypothetical protein